MKTAWALERAVLLLPSDLARLEVRSALYHVPVGRRESEQESQVLVR